MTDDGHHLEKMLSLLALEVGRLAMFADRLEQLLNPPGHQAPGSAEINIPETNGGFAAPLPKR